MSRPFPLQSQFTGMRRDFPRNRMPPGSVWDLVNMLPGIGAPVRERGPWIAHSGSTSSVTANGTYIQGGVYATFSPTAGPNRVNVAIDENGNVFTCSDAGALSRIGSVGYTSLDQNPVFMGGVAATAATAVYTGLVIIPQGSAAVPQKYNGTALTALNGSPPQALFAGVYKDYLVLGNGTAGGTTYPNRVWFSPPGDPDCATSGSVTAWDTTDSWIDFNDSVFGFGATPNALIVFHRTGISRIRGSVAPPEQDMVVDHNWHRINLLDPFSIVEHEGFVYWCSGEGVFRTDGVTVEDLTLKGGMKDYWGDLVQFGTKTPSTWSIAAGILRNHLFIQIVSGAFSLEVDGFLVNLDQHSWARTNNLRATTFWTGLVYQAEELFFGSRVDPGSGIYNSRKCIASASTVFDPQTADDPGGDFAQDAATSVFTSALETPFYELGRPGLKRLKRLFVGYDMKPTLTITPDATVAYATEPGDEIDEDDYTSIGTLSDTSSVTAASLQAYERVAFDVNQRVPGISFRFSRETKAGDFAIHDLGLEVHHQEESKR